MIDETCKESETYNQGFKDGEKHERKKWILILKATFENTNLINSLISEVDLVE